MEWYGLLRNLHLATAVITAMLFLLRLSLDAGGTPQWRRTPLRVLPHVNDSLLLASGIGLILLSPWMPGVHHWLTLKLVLLVGYIVTGKMSLDGRQARRVRVAAALAALVQLGAILALALWKPL